MTRYIGARIPRREDPRFLTGRTRYVDDLRLPRMVHAAFVRSRHAHAEIRGVELGRAGDRRGVLGLLRGEEAARLARPIRGDLRDPGWRGTDWPVLAWPRARFAGEAVAVVAAIDRYVAEDAADLVEVDDVPLAAVTDLERALGPGSPLVHEAWGDNVFLARRIVAGDLAGARAAADLVWEGTFRVQRHTGYPLEGRACLADYERETGLLTVYSSTQLPHLLRTQLADLLGLPEHRTRVVAPDVGGGFGIKAHVWPEEVAVCLLAMRLGRPVKWVEDSREHLQASVHAHEHLHRVQVAVRRDGTILGLSAEILVDSGAYSVWPETASLEAMQAAVVLPGTYRIRNYEAWTRAVATNKCPIGAYRGIARPATVFTMERTIDEMARVLGLDPLEVRFRNSIADDEFPYTTATGLTYDSASPVASLRTAADAVGYPSFRAEQAAARGRGRHLGLGVGTYIEFTAPTTAFYARRGDSIVRGYDSVTVSLDPSGKVTVDSSLHSHGQGHETTFAQVVAERLGVPIEDVRVRFGDTMSAPYGMGTYASRSAVLGGGAGWQAAGDVRAALLRIAAHLLEASPDDLEIVAGEIGVRGSSHRLPVSEVARLAFHRPERLPAGVTPADLASTRSYDAAPGEGTYSNAAHAAIVEVDPATGAVRLLRYVVAEDCGVMINPLIVDGQVHGGVAQGIGGALLERLVYDPDGQLLSQTLAEYLLPGATDVPHIEVHHLSTPSPLTIGGFKGMGEGGAIAPLAAIANAVADALAPFGVSVTSLPLSPDAVLSLLDGRPDTLERPS
jgi:carbon-monoxide dehydrogenase large subunit